MHLPPSLTTPLLTAVYCSIRATLSFKETGRDAIDALDAQKKRMIFSLWHDELFGLIPVARQIRVMAVVSPSKDGDMLTAILTSQHVGAVRGSSTRGGLRALLELSHIMKKELVHACFTLDGPSGPRHKAKEGAIFLANLTDAHIIPVRIRSRHHWELPSWDKFQVPIPFTTVDIHFGTPWRNGLVEVPDRKPETIKAATVRLEKELQELGKGFISEDGA